jgi:autotransporter-associated beta strand protein
VVNNGTWAVNGAQTINTSTLSGTGEFAMIAATDALAINHSDNTRFNGRFTGQGSFSKNGAGTLLLSGASTNAGGAVINAGTLDTRSGGTLADNGAVTVASGATFNAATADTIGAVRNDGTFQVAAKQNVASLVNTGTTELHADLESAGNVTNHGTLNVYDDRTVKLAGLTGAAGSVIDLGQSANVLHLDTSAGGAYAGTIIGNGGLEKLGAGTVSLAGANTYSGGTLVSAGTLETIDGGTLDDAGAVVIAEGATFKAGSVDTIGVVDNRGAFRVAANQTVASLVNSGSVDIDAGLASTNGVSNNASASVNQRGDVTTSAVVNNGRWSVGGARRIGLAGLFGNGDFALAHDSTLTLQQSGDSLFGGTFSGNGALVKDGAGTLALSNASTHLGGTTVNAGTLDTTSGGTLADTGAVRIASGARFVAGTADTIGAVSNSGSFVVNAGHRVASLSNSGVVDLNAGLASAGAVTNDGVLNLNANLASAGAVVNNGSMRIAGQRAVDAAGLAGNASGVVSIPAAGVLALNQAGNTTYAGQIVGAGSMVKSGAGTLTLTRTPETAAGAVDLAGVLAINEGTVALDGEYILKKSMTVAVNSNETASGTLKLVNGAQSIHALGGAGLIDLGTNRLTVEQGGSFSGSVVGSGVLDIHSGDFKINQSLTSTDPTSLFTLGGEPAASTATVASGGTLQFPTVKLDQGSTLVVASGGAVNSDAMQLTSNSTLDIGNQASVVSKKVDVTGNSQLNVKGVLTADTVSVTSTDGLTPVLHLGDAGDYSVRGAVRATRTDFVGSTLSGNGSLSGQVTMGANSMLSPGNSPGSIQVDDLTLAKGSTTRIEVGGVAGSRGAGVNYDAVQVAGTLKIDDGAALLIANYNGESDLALGETLQVLEVAPGKVSGKFGSASKDYGQEALFSLGTGSVIGLGAGGYGGFYSKVAVKPNEAAMLDGLVVNSAGGVKQMYGGKLAERLVSAYAAGADTSAVFARSSPEAYASLVEQGKQSLFFSPGGDIADMLGKAESGGTATLYTRTRKADDSAYAKYELQANGLQLGYGKVQQDVTWKAGLGVENGKTESAYLDGKSTGVTATLSAAKALPGVQGLHVTARVAYAGHDNDLSRQTNAGTAKANGVSSSAWMGGIGLAHLAEINRLRLQTTVEAAPYSVTADGFSETNASSASDALSVDRLKQSGVALVLGMDLSGKLSDNLSFNTGFRLVHDNQNHQAVTARLVTENAAFTVQNPGLGNTQFNVRGGLNYRIANGGNVGLSLASYGSKGTQANVSYSHSF